MIEEMLLLLVLGLMAHSDCKNREIDVRIAIFTGVCGIAWHIFTGEINLSDIAGGAGVGLFLGVISYATGGRVGEGDAAIFVMTGIYLGFWKNIELFMLSLYIAAAVAVIMIFIMKKERDFKIPFAPFVLAAYVAMLV